MVHWSMAGYNYTNLVTKISTMCCKMLTITVNIYKNYKNRMTYIYMKEELEISQHLQDSFFQIDLASK